MPKPKDLKRRAGARVAAKKGRGPRTDLAEIAGMSDDAVAAKTQKTWQQWVRVLDAADAASSSHKEIARHLHEEHGLPGWWAQMVTVGYERIRGLREKGQRRGGGFDVNKSKTYPVALATLYKAFDARTRRRWLGDAQLTVKKATREKSMRIEWADGTPVEVHFWEKGAAKSQVQLQHRKLPDKAAAEQVRADWTARLAALGELLARR